MPFSGERLRGLREEKGLTRDQLAEASQTSRQYISHLENGVKTNPTVDLVEMLAAALEVPITELLDLPEKPKKDKKSQGK